MPHVNYQIPTAHKMRPKDKDMKAEHLLISNPNPHKRNDLLFITSLFITAQDLTVGLFHVVQLFYSFLPQFPFFFNREAWVPK